jgi:hypothetical protein
MSTGPITLTVWISRHTPRSTESRPASVELIITRTIGWWLDSTWASTPHGRG